MTQTKWKSFWLAALIVVTAASLTACGGGGGAPVIQPQPPNPVDPVDPVDPVEPPVSGSIPIPRLESGNLKLPSGSNFQRSLYPVEYTIRAGSKNTIHGLNFSCPSGGPNCTVEWDRNRTTWTWTGARPVVKRTANHHDFTLPSEHGLPVGQITIEPFWRWTWKGNVAFQCHGSQPCVLTITPDGKASYDPRSGSQLEIQSFGYPVSLPPNHGLSSDTVYSHFMLTNTGETLAHPPGYISIVTGATETHGNVAISCPSEGPGSLCDLQVFPDGRVVTGRRNGLIPTVAEARSPWRLASGLGLAAGEFVLQPGTWDIRDGVKLSCPASGPTCTVRVSTDGTAYYDPTGGLPHVVTGYTPLVSGLPSNHGLPIGEIVVGPPINRAQGYGHNPQVYGNVVIGCSHFSDTCRLAITKDGRVYRKVPGSVPWIQPLMAYLPLAQGHDIPVGEVRLNSGASVTRGDTTISCPSGGHSCTLVIATNGTASFQKTGNAPVVTVPHAYVRENLWAEDPRDHWNESNTLRKGMELSAVDSSSVAHRRISLETIFEGVGGHPDNGADKFRNVSPDEVQIVGERDGLTYGQWKSGPAGTLNIEFDLNLVPGHLNLEFSESDKRHLRAWAQRHGKLWSRRLRDDFEKRVIEHDSSLGRALELTKDTPVDDILLFMDNTCDSPGCAAIYELEATANDFEPWVGAAGLNYHTLIHALEALSRSPMGWIGDTLTHEIGHALGITGVEYYGDGRSRAPSVTRYVNEQNHTFEGPQATKANGGQPIPFQWQEHPGGQRVPPNTPGAEPDYTHPGVCDSVMSYHSSHSGCGVPPITPSDIDFAWLDDIGYDILDGKTASKPEVYGWGAWGDYSAWGVGVKRVLVGPKEDIHGQSRFYDNLYARADAFGIAPESRLNDNEELAGSVTWSGSVLGVDLGQDMLPPVFGDAQLQIDISSLAGTARFDNLRVLVESQSEPFRASALEYTIQVHGNSFSDAGNRSVSGGLYGPSHEEMAGVLDDRRLHVNLLAGFGGKR